MILDTTLREGELHPGIKYTHQQRLVIAEALGKIGVPRIEFSIVYPQRSGRMDDIVEAIDLVHSYGAQAILQFRAFRPDLELATRFNVDGAGVYLAISHLQGAKIHDMGDEQRLDQLRDSIVFLKDHGFQYRRAVLEDAGRYFSVYASLEDTLDKYAMYVKGVAEAGATVISIPDTSGVLHPQQAEKMIRRTKAMIGPDIEIAGHFHNDYGNALTNALAVLTRDERYRVDEIHTSIRGIGARNGITDLYELIVNLEDLYRMQTSIDRTQLRSLYELYLDTMHMRFTSRECLAPNVTVEQGGTHQAQQTIQPTGYIPQKKLEYDTREIRFVASDIMSRRVIEQLMGKHQIPQASIQDIVKTIADQSIFRSRTMSPPEVRDIIQSVTGIKLPYDDVRHVVYGADYGYIHLNLRPQYPVAAIINELYTWDGIEKVDEVYGDIDLIVLARLYDAHGESIENKIRQRFETAIERINTLIIE